jgi:hypothetical protein
MKFFYTLLVIVLILLTACQSASPETTPTLEKIEQPEEQADPTTEPVTSVDPYPHLAIPQDPNDPYPALQVPMVSNDPYAAPVEGATTFTWEETKTLILSGQVIEVAQQHSLDVTMILKDGRIVTTVEPEIDAVFILLDECGEICKDVIRATE